MNHRDAEILNWVRAYRPDCLSEVESFLGGDPSSPAIQGIQALVAMAFEAGRQFQHARPEAPLNNPSIYLDWPTASD